MAGGVYEIAAAPTAPRAAREAVDACCEGLSAGAKHTVRLLVSELVSNGVQHAGAPGDPIHVRFAVDARSVRVAVTAPGPGFEPGVSHPGPDAESGYGLFLVDRMADSWGASNNGATTVWFELRHSRAEPPRPDRDANGFPSSRQARAAVPPGWRPSPTRGSRFHSPRRPDRTE